MRMIHVNEDILLSEGYSEYEIDTERDLDLTFRAYGKSDVLISIVHAGNVRIRTFAGRDAKVSYLFWNLCKQPTDFDENHEVMSNADVTVAYGECNGAETRRNTYVALRGEGARALLSSASLVNENKNYHMEVVNFAPHTYGDIQNYAVVLEHGKLLIDAVGKIVKGAHRSESHQTSRALSFSEGQSSEILPELLIDEDDVQASHAMSIGRVDEDQLYYMQSRGLSDQQCTSLISAGYLLPITKTLDNEELRERLKMEMERKIGDLC
jgi:Fe-S cluster assembly protein SufD